MAFSTIKLRKPINSAPHLQYDRQAINFICKRFSRLLVACKILLYLSFALLHAYKLIFVCNHIRDLPRINWHFWTRQEYAAMRMQTFVWICRFSNVFSFSFCRFSFGIKYFVCRTLASNRTVNTFGLYAKRMTDKYVWVSWNRDVEFERNRKGAGVKRH